MQCSIHLHPVLFNLYRCLLPESGLQVCALPLAYYLKHQAAIPWDTIQECCTLTAQSEGSRHREAVLHCKETTGNVPFCASAFLLPCESIRESALTRA
jgi:hypothetical protein